MSPVASIGNFADLRKQVTAMGFFERKPLFYICKGLFLVTISAAGVAVIIVTQSIWLHLAAAVLFAFIFGQIGLLFHDAGHRQIFAATKRDNVVGYTCGLCLGTSLEGWMDIHNRHHAHPNHEDSDPDIDLPFFAYAPNQIFERKGFVQRLIVRNQGWLYFPLLTLTAFSMRATSLRYILRTKAMKKVDAMFFFLHFVLYVSFIALFMPWWHAILFAVVHQTLWGLYMGSVFAPNHKGMPIIEKGKEVDFLRGQVETSRNIRSNRLIDFWYGGLNFQIEHHLFPNMPRSNLRKAHVLVKKFCKENGISYYETGMFQSYREIVAHMHSIASAAKLYGL